jgi:hypothetical protein
LAVGARGCDPQQFSLQMKIRLFIFCIAMLLHRYLGSHAYETLKDAKLKTSRISSFNDPFEFLFCATGNMTAKKAREYILSRRHHPDFLQTAARHIPGLLVNRKAGKILDKRLPQMIASMVANFERFKNVALENRISLSDEIMRVICFSDPKVKLLDEILIWSHYAKKHEGIRIGFEFPDGNKHQFEISKIKYQEKRIEVDFSNGFSSETVGHALVESAKIKSLAWQYENEYRLLSTPRRLEMRTMADSTVEYFLGLKRDWVKSVDFGVRCPQAEIHRILDLLKTDYPKNVLRRKAEFHKSEYALEYKEI